jgi:hypothetical protein
VLLYVLNSYYIYHCTVTNQIALVVLLGQVDFKQVIEELRGIYDLYDLEDLSGSSKL